MKTISRARAGIDFSTGVIALVTGFLSAIMFLIGQWTPFRGKEDRLFLQPRVWILAGMVILIGILSAGRPERHGREVVIRAEKRLLFFSGLFLFYYLSTFFWSLDQSLGMLKAADLLMILLTLGCFRYFQLGCGRNAFIEAFWGSLLLIATGYALVCLKTGLPMIGTKTNVLGGGRIVFGRIMGLMCIAALYFVMKKRYFALILFALGALLIVLSGSRGALLAAMIGIVTFLLISRIRIRKVMGILLVGTSLISAALLFTSTGQNVRDTFQKRVVDLTIENHYDADRFLIYKQALELGMESPFIGSGLAAFSIRTDFLYPHNVLLEIFVEGGMIGVILFMAMLGAALRLFWKYRFSFNPASVAAFSLILVASQFSGDIYDSRGLFLFPILAISVVSGKGFLGRNSVAQKKEIQRKELSEAKTPKVRSERINSRTE